MSGPKVIDYQAVERERVEAARRRWLALTGRADALRERCAAAGHPECAVQVGRLAESSIDRERQCDELAALLAAADDELSRRQFAERTREVASDLQEVLADLERREQQTLRMTSDAQSGSEARPQPVLNYGERVSQQLAALLEPSTELDQAARAVLSETDADRAHILYRDLAQRVSLANKLVSVRDECLAEIAGIRAQLDSLTDPAPLRSLLDSTADAARRGEDVTSALRQAREAITAQLDASAASADREYVRAAVAESLSELGYEVVDVSIATPETLVVRQNSTHGVRADIHDGRIDIRAVRLSPSPSTSADRDAEDEFCDHIPGLIAALGGRGVSANITSRKLPGLFTPETIALRGKGTAMSVAEDRRPHTHKRTAR